MKNTKRFFKLTFASIMIALMFAFSWTPLGMIPLGFTSATTVFIPVAIGICVIDDFRYTVALGLGFGISSLIRALAPNGILDPFFVNPLVSVLPRVIASLLTHLCYRALVKLIKKKIVVSGFTGALMAFFNTLFTIPLLILFIQLLGEGTDTIGMTYGAFILVILPSMAGEILVGAIITTIVFTAIYMVQNRSSKEDEEIVKSEENDNEASNDTLQA